MSMCLNLYMVVHWKYICGKIGCMNDPRKNRPDLEIIARDYFAYLGRNLPQLCANDEFYFLPRSEKAIEELERLDDLGSDVIQDRIGYVQNLLRKLPPIQDDDLDYVIDRTLLEQSMKSFIREFDDDQVWRKDPTLYVKIPLFATDHVLSQVSDDTIILKIQLHAILKQIPSFLGTAQNNLVMPSRLSCELALNMIRDALNFYHRQVRSFIEDRLDSDKHLLAVIDPALRALRKYHRHLRNLPAKKSFAIGEENLAKILKISLNYPRSPRDILNSAQDSYALTFEKLKNLTDKTSGITLSRKNHPRPSTCISSPQDLVDLYTHQVRDLRDFFYTNDLISFPPGESVQVLITPSYLTSLRATASYRAPLTGSSTSQGFFFITPSEDRLETIENTCAYLCAHETYPGHHILDHIRIHHPNPIRRQIESPLFYEGWSCYAEHLLDDLGYVTDPGQQIIGLKRQLWRTLRAILDIELQTCSISLEEAQRKIISLGYTSGGAQHQAQRFALTPGYQLCYFTGMHEILRLRRGQSNRRDIKSFHDIVVGSGQIPFSLVEKKLESSAS
jgi:hypothetical protein